MTVLPQPAYAAAVPPWDCTGEDLDRYLADCQAAYKRLDEESLILGLGWRPSVCQSHEVLLSWSSATAGRWYLALPERRNSPDSGPVDWDHRHYPHKHEEIKS